MSIVLENQPLKLRLNTHVDLSTAASHKIVYRKPDGTSGEFISNIQSDTFLSTSIPGDVLSNGWWYFHAEVTFIGYTKPHIGTRASQYIHAKYERQYA